MEILTVLALDWHELCHSSEVISSKILTVSPFLDQFSKTLLHTATPVQHYILYRSKLAKIFSHFQYIEKSSGQSRPSSYNVSIALLRKLHLSPDWFPWVRFEFRRARPKRSLRLTHLHVTQFSPPQQNFNATTSKLKRYQLHFLANSSNTPTAVKTLYKQTQFPR